MLVSDDGEADNAGRAVGQLARRLGLSGGDLKAWLLAGAEARGRSEGETAALRRALQTAEAAARAAERDRDVLVAENGALRVALYRRQARARGGRLLALAGGALLLVLAAGGMWFAADPPVRPDPLARAPAGTRIALVRAGGATVHRVPDRAGEVLARLPAGSRLVVAGTEWRALMQWVRVEVDGRPGYVLPTEVEIF